MSKKIFLLLLITLTSCSEKVDLIVYNAEIYTVSQDEKATAIAVKDGKFIFVGDDSVMSKYSSIMLLMQKVFQFILVLLIHTLIFII